VADLLDPTSIPSADQHGGGGVEPERVLLRQRLVVRQARAGELGEIDLPQAKS
jgi:hypothetical protein